MNSRLEQVVVGITILFILSAIPNLILQWSMPNCPKAIAAIYTGSAIGITLSGLSLYWHGENVLRFVFLFGLFISAFGFVASNVTVGLFGLVNYHVSIGSVIAAGHKEGVILNLPLIIPFVVVGAQSVKTMREAEPI